MGDSVLSVVNFGYGNKICLLEQIMCENFIESWVEFGDGFWALWLYGEGICYVGW